MFTSLWPYIVPGTTLDHPLAMLATGVWFLITFLFLWLRGSRSVDPATERRERLFDLFLYLSLGVSLGSFFVLLATGVHSPSDGPSSMGMSLLVVAFLAVLVVLMAVALYDMRRRSDLAERDRAKSSWLLAAWLLFVAAAVVVARDELGQRAYNTLEWAVMLFGAGLMVALTAGIVGFWWWLRH
jgi:hypothetical protein